MSPPGIRRAAAERVADRWQTVYCTQMGPGYPRMLRERFGYAADVEALLAATEDHDDPALPPAARRLAGDVLLLATHEDVTDATAQWTEAGADRFDLILLFRIEPAEVLAAARSAVRVGSDA